MLPAHKSARAAASTLYELVFPLMGSPTIMKPWRTSIISYTCQGQERPSLTWHKNKCYMSCERKYKSLSCIHMWHNQISALCTLLAGQSLNPNQRAVMLLWQFSLKQFKKLFSLGILPFSLLNVIPQLQQQPRTGCEGINQRLQITALN